MADMPGSAREHTPHRRALEQTVPASEFGPESAREAMSRTASDEWPEQTAGRYLRRTASDPTSRSATDETLGSFGDSSVVPPELAAGVDPAKPRFEVVRKLGSGATSQVYAVRDNSLERTLAVKFLRSSRGGREEARNRFLYEARVTAGLEHPNIMPIHDIGLDSNSRVFFTMKNIDGSTIGDAIRAEARGEEVPDGYRDVNDKLAIVSKVCDALAFAHDRGYVHQDIKPDNIMLGRYGEVLLLDWGCALHRDRVAEAAGKAIYGTPAYMSPEQARRERVDERSDIYCLGATLYHMLTLEYPAWVEDPERFWEMKRAGELSPLEQQAASRVPPLLLAVCRKATAPDAAERYQSAVELREALRLYQVHAESIQLTAEAGARLHNSPGAPGYEVLSQVLHDVRQALRMWPENPDARSLEHEARSIFEARQRRVRIVQLLALALGLCAVGFVTYLGIDYFRYFGSWRTVYHWNPSLGRPEGLVRTVNMMDLMSTSSDSVAFDGTSLVIAEHHTYWFADVTVPGDVRFEARVMWPGQVDGFECHI